MNKLMRRLRQVEARAPKPVEPSVWEPVPPYLSFLELCLARTAMGRAIEEGGGRPLTPQDAAELVRMYTRGLERQQAGWLPNDKRREELDKVDRAKSWALWHLILILRGHHPGQDFTELSDTDYCNPLDVELAEIEAFVKLLHQTKDRAEILAHAPAIMRLRIAGQPLSLEQFEDLVFRGILPEKSEEPLPAHSA